MWSRIARRYKVANLAERLTIYREVPNSLSRERSVPYLETIAAISAESLAVALGADSGMARQTKAGVSPCTMRALWPQAQARCWNGRLQRRYLASDRPA